MESLAEHEFRCVLENIQRLYLKLIGDAKNPNELEALRIELFGRKHGIFPVIERALWRS